MARPPSVDPEMIRQALLEHPGLTRAQIAEKLAEKLGKPVAAVLIRQAILRHPEWGIPPAKTGGSEPAMDYFFEVCLGKIHQDHRKSHDFIMLATYERHQAGLLARDRPSVETAIRYVQHRLSGGLVTDYHPATGFFHRPALPWELDAQSYLRLPLPEYAVLEMQTALLDTDLAAHVRKHWQAWFETHTARVRVDVKGSG